MRWCCASAVSARSRLTRATRWISRRFRSSRSYRICRSWPIRRTARRAAIDRGVTLEEAASAADLLFLSQPISGILETLRVLDPWVRPDALVTDAGSTKQAIVDEAKRSLRRCGFVGGHPMAGKEVRGV